MDNDIPTRQVHIRGETSLDSAAANEVQKAIEVAAEQKLTTFVNAQIESMRAAIHLGSGHDPTFFEVNEALCSYQDTNLGILALHNTAKIEAIKAKEAFDDWFAGRYIQIRDRVNPRNLSAQKWYSQKEIEMMVRKEYPEEYNKYNWDVIATDQQLNFLRRMLDSWASHQYVLTQLSKNLIAEMNGLGVDEALSRSVQ